MSLAEALSARIAKNPYESTVASMTEEILRRTQLSNPEEGLALAPSGWHPVRASFEVDKVTRRFPRVLFPSGVESIRRARAYRCLIGGMEGRRDRFGFAVARWRWFRG